MISVVIPLFNKQAHIRKTVDSVLNQTFRDFEILVINDGSTDRGAEMLEAVSDSRLRVISQKNAGVSTARNNGVKAAKHNIIAFLDADDWWEPDYLEQMAALVHEYPEAGLWGCAYKEIKNGRERPAKIGVPEGFEKGIINYFEVYANTLWMPLFPSSAIVQRRVLNEFGGFKPELKLGEDFHLWLRIALKHQIAYLNKTLVYYNQDVEVESRAIGKLHKPADHVLWNLAEFTHFEELNPSYKQLIDKLRVYSLYPYYLDVKYRDEAKDELRKINWDSQTLFCRIKFKLPLTVLKMMEVLKRKASRIKNKILITVKW